MSNIKQCHEMYLGSANLFDNKLQAVIGIEKSNSRILKQLRSLNSMVSDITDLNLKTMPLDSCINH